LHDSGEVGKVGRSPPLNLLFQLDFCGLAVVFYVAVMKEHA